jgi:hypothetical protein
MGPSFSRRLRAFDVADSTRSLHAVVSFALEQLEEERKSGLGGKLFDGFFGGRIPLCGAIIAVERDGV